MLSVIIPTLNSADDLEVLLPLLDEGRARSVVGEIVIIDAGSKDGTRKLASQFGARLFYGKQGRGLQLNAGTQEARGKWFLFLHADTTLVPIWIEAVLQFMDRDDEDKAGVFKFALDDPSKMARILERGVALRWRFFRLPYGDQGLLISRKLYNQIGGFKPMVLMEDVDIVRRIGRKRLELLPARALTSSVRYRRNGFILRAIRNLFVLGLYFCGVSPDTLAKIYRW